MYAFKWDTYVAELIGTFALVFVGSMSVSLFGTIGSFGVLSIAFAHGLVLMVMVYSIGPISGCHINPAVTIGAWIARKISSFDGIMYIVFQLIGAAFAGVVNVAVVRTFTREVGVPSVERSIFSIPQSTGLAVEAILTFFLVFVVFGTAFNPKPQKEFAGLAIGMTLTIGLLIGGPLTGGALNPARWFGPAVAANDLNEFWIYTLGPIIGGAVAALLFTEFFLKASGKS